jgi:predicted nucleic acid-binding protein
VRIVVDTNLLVSAVISAGGLPRQLLDLAQAGAFEL